ncbi:TlpA family protein disulfide reductase [Polaribacter tangerinus]|uniref:TlpA family protein disulfide reductase n=1 Tax=Polaribacter tangerinus TaxID=1920034 RepID=UPI000B4A96E0|nr:TlpA disulfide reductase family protein [Polaribacter tangerinus]
MFKKIVFNGGLVILVYILIVFIAGTQKIIFPVFMILAFIVSMFMSYKNVTASFIPLLLIWLIHLFLPDSKLNNVIIYIVFTPLTFLLGYYLRNKFYFLKILYLIILILVGIYGFSNFWMIIENYNARQKKDAPKMEFISENGNQIRLDTIQNKIIVLDYWTTSCGVCFQKFPKYEELFMKYKNNPNINLYAVNIPERRDTIGHAKKMIEKYNYQFPVLYSETDTVPKLLGFNRYPHVIILKDKKVRYNGYPVLEDDVYVHNLENEIEKLLNE